MARPQFDIRFLLLLTAVVCFAMTFATVNGSWLFAVLVTCMLATFASAVVSLVWFVVLPLFNRD